jgi:hypothetical protein
LPLFRFVRLVALSVFGTAVEENNEDAVLVVVMVVVSRISAVVFGVVGDVGRDFQKRSFSPTSHGHGKPPTPNLTPSVPVLSLIVCHSSFLLPSSHPLTLPSLPTLFSLT